MNNSEAAGAFSPFNVIAAKKRQREASLVEEALARGVQRPEQRERPFELSVEIQVIEPIVNLIKEYVPIVHRETVNKTEERERTSFSGHKDHVELRRGVRQLLSGRNPRMLRTDTEQITVPVTREVASSLDTVHIAVFVDLVGHYVNNLQNFGKMLRLLQLIQDITPDTLNELQTDQQIKEVELEVFAMVPTPDGLRMTLFTADPTQPQQLLEKITQYLLNKVPTATDMSKNDLPRLTHAAKALSIFEVTQKLQSDQQLSEALHTVLILDNRLDTNFNSQIDKNRSFIVAGEGQVDAQGKPLKQVSKGEIRIRRHA